MDTYINFEKISIQIGDILIINKNNIIKYIGLVTDIKDKNINGIYKKIEILHINYEKKIKFFECNINDLKNNINILRIYLNDEKYTYFLKNLIIIRNKLFNISNQINQNMRFENNKLLNRYFEFGISFNRNILNTYNNLNEKISLSKANNFSNILEYIEYDIHICMNDNQDNNYYSKIYIICSTFIANIINLALVQSKNNSIFINPDICLLNNIIDNDKNFILRTIELEDNNILNHDNEQIIKYNNNKIMNMILDKNFNIIFQESGFINLLKSLEINVINKQIKKLFGMNILICLNTFFIIYYKKFVINNNLKKSDTIDKIYNNFDKKNLIFSQIINNKFIKYTKLIKNINNNYHEKNDIELVTYFNNKQNLLNIELIFKIFAYLKKYNYQYQINKQLINKLNINNIFQKSFDENNYNHGYYKKYLKKLKIISLPNLNK